jgi:uncharacterized protein (DUF1501 family)
MNPLSDPAPGTCGSSVHLSRRALFRGTGVAALGFGAGIGNSWLTPLSQALALGAEKSSSRPKSVIVLWMQGGASQLETFDPHPGKEIAAGTGAIDTSVKGIQFAEGLEQSAELMSEFSVIRSVVSKEGDHARGVYNMKTGFRPFPGIVHPSIGAVVCHELPHPDAKGKPIDIPTHLSILPTNFPGRGGYLGAQFDAFQLGDPVNPVPDLSSRVDDERDERRFKSLSVLENNFAAGRLADLEGSRTLHRTAIGNARQMMTSEQIDAFDVSRLPKAEREAYGDHRFGRGCLAALALIEAGVRCVEVTLNGWDTHANNHEGHTKQKAILDPALTSLIQGLQERGLYDDTIVLVGSEFGRTPKINLAEGRDHWPHGFSILLGGGGLRGGLAIGETDPSGKSKEPGDPVRVEDVHATILERLGIDYEYELLTPIGRPLPISEGRPVRALL